MQRHVARAFANIADFLMSLVARYFDKKAIVNASPQLVGSTILSTGTVGTSKVISL